MDSRCTIVSRSTPKFAHLVAGFKAWASCSAESALLKEALHRTQLQEALRPGQSVRLRWCPAWHGGDGAYASAMSQPEEPDYPPGCPGRKQLCALDSLAQCSICHYFFQGMPLLLECGHSCAPLLSSAFVACTGRPSATGSRGSRGAPRRGALRRAVCSACIRSSLRFQEQSGAARCPLCRKPAAEHALRANLARAPRSRPFPACARAVSPSLLSSAPEQAAMHALCLPSRLHRGACNVRPPRLCAELTHVNGARQALRDLVAALRACRPALLRMAAEAAGGAAAPAPAGPPALAPALAPTRAAPATAPAVCDAGPSGRARRAGRQRSAAGSQAAAAGSPAGEEADAEHEVVDLTQAAPLSPAPACAGGRRSGSGCGDGDGGGGSGGRRARKRPARDPDFSPSPTPSGRAAGQGLPTKQRFVAVAALARSSFPRRRVCYQPPW